MIIEYVFGLAYAILESSANLDIFLELHSAARRFFSILFVFFRKIKVTTQVSNSVVQSVIS